MATRTLSGEGKLGRLVEKQMRNWEIAREQHPDRPGHVVVADFITLANVVGAGGHEVATALSQSLGWPVYDRELLASMAGDDEARARLYRSMDERDLGLFEETLRSIIEQSFRKNDYFHQLVKTVLDLARKGPGVFVGRSVDLILPKTQGLRVQLVASMEYCAKNFAKLACIDLEQARIKVAGIEAERLAFMHHHFHLEANDPTRFDLVIHVERFSTAQIVALILAAHNQRATA